MKNSEGKAVGKTARDLVCGMDVDISASGVLKAEYQGKTYYFCCAPCKVDFDKDPEKYLKQQK